ncbi:helix-turn-helix domain-containing protein [Clostridiaceae bacterium M8S5]|nr:helix-turn-helix domain-containing protein [Clostridiaceae bacterium M8S5]
MISDKRGDLQVVIRNINEHAYYWHDSIAIINVLKGTIKLSKKTKEYILNRNDIVVINVGEVHNLEGISTDNRVLCIFIDQTFCRVKIKDFDRIYINCNTVSQKQLSNTKKFKKIQNYIIELLFTMTNLVDYDYDKEICEVIMKLLMYIVDNFDITRCGKDFKGLDRKQIMRYKKIYESVFSSNGKLKEASLTEIARHYNINYDYLRKDIKKKFGHTFTWIKYCLMAEEAIKQLLKTESNILQISFECGFSDPKYLIKYFKVFYKCTPSTLRSRYKNNNKKDNYCEYFKYGCNLF